MNEPVLKVNDLSSGYGDIKVLHQVNLSVLPGEVTAVLGGNGAGKTTLLTAIAGILPARQGSVVLDGTDVTRLGAHRRTRGGIALVQEGKRVFHRRTVRENLTLGGVWLRRKEREEGVERALDLFPILREMSESRAATLSGGQQQMLAIGQVLVADPSVVMLDEPSAGLAPVIVHSVWDAVERLRAEGKAVLLVEQLVRQTLGIADHVVVLDRGRVVIDRSGGSVTEGEVRDVYLGAAPAR